MIRHHRTGLTLLELVVVLAILSVLTLVAVVATGSTIDQARFDVTQQTLTNLQTAIAGPTNQYDSHGDVVVNGFLADTGSLPRAQTIDPSTALAELYLQPSRLVAYQAWPTSDPEVKVFSGWRGPYLRPPLQSAALPTVLDGWGNPFLLNGGTFAVDDAIVAVQSGGGSDSV